MTQNIHDTDVILNEEQCFKWIVTNPPRPLTEEDIWFQIGHVHEQQKDVGIYAFASLESHSHPINSMKPRREPTDGYSTETQITPRSCSS